jgi:hypothetical protein
MLSLNLIFRFIIDCIWGDRGSPRIERPPSARGPNSMRACSKPTIFPRERSIATSSTSAARSTRRAAPPLLHNPLAEDLPRCRRS